jgi:hypothetical protein
MMGRGRGGSDQRIDGRGRLVRRAIADRRCRFGAVAHRRRPAVHMVAHQLQQRQGFRLGRLGSHGRGRDVGAGGCNLDIGRFRAAGYSRRRGLLGRPGRRRDHFYRHVGVRRRCCRHSGHDLLDRARCVHGLRHGLDRGLHDIRGRVGGWRRLGRDHRSDQFGRHFRRRHGRCNDRVILPIRADHRGRHRFLSHGRFRRGLGVGQ